MRYLRIYLIISLTLLVVSCKSNNLDKANELNDKAVGLYNQGKIEQSISIGKHLLKEYNLNKDFKAQVYRNLAFSYQALEKKDTAKTYFVKSASFYQPNEFFYLINMVDIAIMKNDILMSIDMLEKAYEIDKLHMSVNHTLGQIYMGYLGDEYRDTRKALKFNKQAYKVLRDKDSKSVLAENYLQVYNYMAAKSLYDQLIIDYPDEVNYYYQLGYIELFDGDKDLSTKIFEKVLVMDPSYQEKIEEIRKVQKN